MTLADLNDWIANHQALVATAGIPILTVLVTAIISWRTTLSSTRAQRSERKLARTMKLVEFRQNWIDAIRDDLAAYSALTWSKELQDSAAAKKSW